jgi:hypothetical protein
METSTVVIKLKVTSLGPLAADERAELVGILAAPNPDPDASLRSENRT